MRICGERVLLRAYEWKDLEPIGEWMRARSVTRRLGGAFCKLRTSEQIREYARRFIEGDAGGVNLVVADPQTEEYMGQVNLFFLDTAARKAEIAVVLRERYQGQGYAQEALRHLLDYAFCVLELNRVYLRVCADHARAIRLYRRLGFQTEGVLREELFIDGAYCDVVMMGLLKGEYLGGIQDARGS